MCLPTFVYAILEGVLSPQVISWLLHNKSKWLPRLGDWREIALARLVPSQQSRFNATGTFSQSLGRSLENMGELYGAHLTYVPQTL